MPESEYARQIESLDLPDIPEGYLPENVYVHFDFNMHIIEEHYETTAQLFEDADIIAPEAGGWHPGDLKFDNAISRGSQGKFARALKTSQYSDNPGYKKAYYNTIFGSKKPIIFADSTRQQLLDSAADTTSGTEKLVESKDVDEALHVIADQMASYAQLNAVTSQSFLKSLGPIVTGLLEVNPELAEKDQVTVLCSLYPGNERLWDHFRTQPSTEGQTGASVAVGIGSLRTGGLISRDWYLEGTAPTRTELLEAMVVIALDGLENRTLNPNGRVLDMEEQYARNKSPEALLGEEMAGKMMDDIAENEELQTVLHGIITGKPTRNYRKVITSYIDIEKVWLNEQRRSQ